MSTADSDQKSSAAAGTGVDCTQQQQLRKSRTISAASTAAFQGPTFPAVRRVSSGPLPPPPAGPARRLMVAVDDPSYAPANGGVLDRDWFYPSFLGPHPSRPRASTRARPKPAELLSPPSLEADKQISKPEQARNGKDASKLMPDKEKKKKKIVTVPPLFLYYGCERSSSN